jgi:hypothetical protein
MLIKHTRPDGRKVDVDIDIMGIPVAFFAFILAIPFAINFGFSLPTWTIIAIMGVGIIHFFTLAMVAAWSQIKADNAIKAAKEQSEKSSGE